MTEPSAHTSSAGPSSPEWTPGPGARIARRLVWLPETESTNDHLIALVRSGYAGPGDAVATDHQTRGRGTQGRSWHAEPGSSVLVSVAIEVPGELLNEPARLAIPPSVAVAEWLANTFGVRTRVKPPNDVLAAPSDGSIGFRKVSGTLVETVHDPSGLRVAVLGTGINLNQTAFPEGLAATSVAMLTGTPTPARDATLASLRTFDRVFAEPFDDIEQRWRSLLNTTP